MKREMDIVDSGKEPCRVIDLEYLGGHRLRLWFNDGEEGEIDLAPLTEKEAFHQLRDPKQFIRFGLEHGTLVWSDNLDISPEYLREHIEARPSV